MRSIVGSRNVIHSSDAAPLMDISGHLDRKKGHRQNYGIFRSVIELTMVGMDTASARAHLFRSWRAAKKYDRVVTMICGATMIAIAVLAENDRELPPR